MLTALEGVLDVPVDRACRFGGGALCLLLSEVGSLRFARMLLSACGSLVRSNGVLHGSSALGLSPLEGEGVLLPTPSFFPEPLEKNESRDFCLGASDEALCIAAHSPIQVP